MYNIPLVLPGFSVPERLACNGFHLRMLAIDDVEKDYEAVMASRERLRGLLDPDSPWPDGLTKYDNLVDLGWHQREFTIRHSFAYTVMAADESRCLGCCYIFPSSNAGYDAAVFYWVRSGPNTEARDIELGNAFRKWLSAEWPFKRPAFPGRDITWNEWRSQPK